MERELVDALGFVVDSWPDLIRGRRQVEAPLVGHTASYWLAVWAIISDESSEYKRRLYDVFI